MNTILYTSLESLRKISILLFPVIPTSSENVLNTLGISKNDINIHNYSIDKYLKPSTKLKEFKILFKKYS
jgi:methionyl-tRNA synthetase